MRSKIFIGSSSESVNIIKIVKQKLEPEFECVSWSNNFFEMNQSTYDTLVKKAVGFDYAIFIGGKDDRVFRLGKSKCRRKFAPRDNVYLELGLYTGILTKNRTFFILHKSTTVASDLMGITLNFYSNDQEVEKACEQIKRRIEEEEKINRIGFLPSTSLAIGYYENFLKQVGERLFDIEQISIAGKNYIVKNYDKAMIIVIPENVEEDWISWAKEFYYNNHCMHADINGIVRNLDIKVDYEALAKRGELRIFDVPQTLRSAFYAVNMVLKDGEGEAKFLTEVKKKEAKNFVKTLDNLINTNVQVKERVKIKFVSSYKARI